MSERIHKATLSQSQGREGWSVIFRQPLLERTPDRNKFMNDIIGVVRDAVERHRIALH